MSDLSYRPVLADADAAVHDVSPSRLLIIGEHVPDTVGHATTARARPVGEVQLPAGIYRFCGDEGDDLLLVMTGSASAAPYSTGWDAGDDDPLLAAAGWFEEWWEDATEIPPPVFGKGDQVETVPAGQEGTIRSRVHDQAAWWYQVRVDGRTVSMSEASLRKPPIDDDPSDWVKRPPVSAKRFSATLTRAKLREQLTDTVFSFRATRTVFRPYQFRPVMRLLDTGTLRLLVADEVGLGKTIEAGLVWTELDARGLANRVLVVCPSMLVSKWRAEMEERFGFEPQDLTRPALDDMLDRVERDRLSRRFHAVCSIERLRVWSGLDRMAELSPSFDLVIVDEAHAFRNSGTKSHALGALLSDWADALVFLSATPLNLGNDDLYNLLELLAPGEFDDRAVLAQRLEPNAVLNRISASLLDRSVDNPTRTSWLEQLHALTFGPAVTVRPEYRELQQLLGRERLRPNEIAESKRLIARLHTLSAVVTRTRKVEIQEHKAVREARPIDVQWTEIEAELYLAFHRWQRDRALARGLPVGFVTQMPLRLASTCLPAARDAVLEAAGRWVDDLDDVDEAVDEDQLAPPAELVDLAHRLGERDTKFDAFLAALLPLIAEGKRVLVFTFSRKALAYLQRRLAGVARVDVMHGGILRDDRHTVMRRFRANEFDVLLASRVASEGLDFEFCSAVVNYDLPWNPMEVEQRIGRIDRFGQTEDKVLVLNFHTPGTIETDIIERVHQRIGVFEDSIGELEPILRSHLGDLQRTMFDFALTEGQRTRRLDEQLTAIEEQRLTSADLESAAAYLTSADKAEIDGLEHELVSAGRYIGQPELVELLTDWAVGAGGQCLRTEDGLRLTVRGSTEMERHLHGVQAAGERSAAEVESLARSLRSDLEIILCLDQETARVTGESLLSSSHPLTRAALRVPGTSEARLAHIRCTADSAPPGQYLVLFAVARWLGIRSSTELWTAAVDLAGGDKADDVGGAVLAALAEATLDDSPAPGASSLAQAVARAEGAMRRRQSAEQQRRTEENASLLETRRLSLRQTHSRKQGQISRRIQTLQQTGKTKVLHLQEAQLRNQARILREAEELLDKAQQCSLDVEHLAVCTVVIVASAT